MTVSKAYQLLKQEGYLATDRRSGAVVCRPAASGALSPEQTTQLRLLAGEARLAGVSRTEFLAACAAAFGETEE